MVVFSCSFTHLRIPDHHKNIIGSSLYYPEPLYKISSQSVYNFLSNVVHKQTNKQTERQTNATKDISFAKEVINKSSLIEAEYICQIQIFRQK